MLKAISPMFDPASAQAAAISEVFVATLAICAVIFAIVTGLIALCLIRFRHREGAEDPPSYFGNRNLEIAWTAIPTLIVAGLFVLTAHGMRLSDPPAKDKPDLIVVSHQWWWEARYPNSPAVVANEIHIPVGSNWLVRLESADVIHDFWVARLGRKIDVVPGLTNYLWLSAAAPGTYDGTCAEYCGAQHSWMRFLVVADPPDKLDEWLRAQSAPAQASAAGIFGQGLKTFQDKTCINCHTIRGISGTSTASATWT